MTNNTDTASTAAKSPEVVPATGKSAARQGAEALRTFDGLDAIARYRPEHGGWHIYVRGQA